MCAAMRRVPRARRAVCGGPSRERVLRVLTCGTHKYSRAVPTSTHVRYPRVLTCGTHEYSRWGTPSTHGFDRGVGLAVDRRAHAVAEVLVPLHRLAHLRGYSEYSHGGTPSSHMGVLRVLTWGTRTAAPSHAPAGVLREYVESRRAPCTEGLRSARCGTVYGAVAWKTIAFCATCTRTCGAPQSVHLVSTRSTPVSTRSTL
jgi:hypothetical protein